MGSYCHCSVFLDIVLRELSMVDMCLAALLIAAAALIAILVRENRRVAFQLRTLRDELDLSARDRAQEREDLRRASESVDVASRSLEDHRR